MADDVTYDAALAALDERGPGRMLPDVSRITALAGLLGDPQQAYPSVHVTGTNGKGSVVRMVGALCSAAGLSAGTYTSPHLQTVRERFGLAGRPIGPQRFAEIHAEVDALASLLDAQLAEQTPAGATADRVTYFELLTAMALWWFADVPVDVAVVEVGMGGRWDATNVVRGDVAVLTPIDLDHSELGGTPAEVANEKVGIIKPGATVVCAEQDDEVAAVIERAVIEAGARMLQVGTDLEVVDRAIAVGGQLLSLRVGERVVEDILLPLFGTHQADNAALALGAFAALTGASFDAMEDDVIRHGLGAVAVPGRLEIVRRDPTVVLDGAHNPHGARGAAPTALFRTGAAAAVSRPGLGAVAGPGRVESGRRDPTGVLEGAHNPPGARAAAAALDEAFGFRELVLVVSCFADKDIEGILGAFAGAASHVIVTRVEHPRAAPLERMRDAAMQVWGDSGTVVEVATDVTSALTLARSVARDGDGILVAGSLVTVGAARELELPIGDGRDDDAVVRAPEDDDPDDDRVEMLELLDDEQAFEAAIEDLLDDEPTVADRDAGDEPPG
ncbi:MAG: hypothetical protein JJT89_17730 [Nitriliruptoraceae bacterium]|nr:hypothetical protein [Nitriliruptoraceae bacterium]